MASPVALTSMVTAPSPLTAPPITVSPAVRVTGFDSPVSIASLNDETPSVITPSTGTFAPGRITTRSPAISAATATSSVPPSAVPRRAVSGKRRTSSSSARDAPRTDRISSQ